MKRLLATIIAAALTLGGVCTSAQAQAQQSNSALLNAPATTSALCTAQSCLGLPSVGGPQFSGQSTCWADIAPQAGFTGSFVFEITGSSGNWYQVPGTSWSGGASTTVTTVSSAALVSFAAGANGCRVRMNANSAGGAYVSVYASSASTPVGNTIGTSSVVVTNTSPVPVAIQSSVPLTATVNTAAPCTAGTCTSSVAVINTTPIPVTTGAPCTTGTCSSTVTATNGSPQTVNGSGSASAVTPIVYSIPINGQTSCKTTVTGTFVGTWALRSSIDGTNYTNELSSQSAGGANPTVRSAPMTTTGTYVEQIGAAVSVAFTVTVYVSGTITAYTTCSASAYQNQATYNYAYNQFTATWAPQGSDLGTQSGSNWTYTTSGGLAPFVLNAASTTTCTSLQVQTAATNSGRLVGVTNAGTATQPTLTLYDEGASPTCAAADVRYVVVLGASQIATFANGGIYLTNGLAYTLSAAPTNNIIIQRY